MAELLAFLGVAVVVIVTPGQDTALTVRNTLAGGRSAGIRTAIGVVSGQAVWALAASAGVAALLVASEPAFLALKLAGAAYLVYLGGQALLAAVRRAPAPAHAVRDAGGRELRQGLLSNLGNPKMAVFFSSLLPQFGDSFASPARPRPAVLRADPDLAERLRDRGRPRRGRAAAAARAPGDRCRDGHRARRAGAASGDGRPLGIALDRHGPPSVPSGRSHRPRRGLEMQLELLVVDAPRRDELIVRAGVLGLAVAVLVRRRLPVLAAALTVVAVTVIESRGDDLSSQLFGPFFVMVFVAYSVGAHSDGRELVAGAAVLIGGTVIAVRLDEPPGGADDVFFATTILTGGPLLLGRLVHARVQLNRALRVKAAAAESDRAADAVAGERARIAGELHHLVSAALASMVGQAGAAEQLVRSKPEVAERAFESVERTGREALTEIRTLLGVLRRDDEELALSPQPSLAHVRDLIARVRASGLPVELEVEGTQAPLPAGVDLTAYRVIQEALAAPEARSAKVRLRYGADEVALEVSDLGDARPELLGVRERVAIYGGELVAEPVAGSGYAVRARLPLERAA